MNTAEQALKALKEDVPALVKLLKEKFSTPETAPTSKTFKTDNGELISDADIAVGVDVWCMEADKKVPAPAKTYKLEDNTEVVVEGGKVVDVKKIVPAKEDDFKAIAEEIFKSFPKTDLSKIEVALGELKNTLEEIQKEKAELSAKVSKFEGFKDEVISILEKFSAQPSAAPTAPKKTNSSKSIFNTELTMEERIAILNETK